MISKKIFLVFVIFSSVFIFHTANAKIVITEVMYDLEGTDTGREWIEVYNDGTESVDLSNYKLFEADTNHGLTLSQGSKSIPSLGYAILVSDKDKFKTDWPSFTGSIFDTSFSLNNDGESIAIKDGNLNVTDQYTYSSSSGANGDGKSLQKINNSWVSSLPTPGAINSSSSTEIPTQNTNTSESTTSSTKVSAEEEYKLSTTIYVNKVAIVGIPFEVKASTLSSKGEWIVYGEYFWNFGDGDSKKVKLNSGDKTLHTYFYPGKYLLNVGYYTNDFLEKPDSYNEVYIDVISADVLLKVIGDEKDFFIELTNNSNSDIDVSLWYIQTGEKVFTLPKNTNLPAKNKITIPARITNFSFGQKDNLDLYNKQGERIFESKILTEQKSITKKVPADFVSKSNSVNYVSLKQNTEDTVIPLTANISDSIETESSKDNSSDKSSLIYFIGFIVLVIVSAVSVFYLRKGNPHGDSDEFEILDE